ncbi:MAG: hypothetical protein GEV07_16260 [Streptosporangiales bacterium]|nr:hypothetical protein [Streptosporangiales bacterium]
MLRTRPHSHHPSRRGGTPGLRVAGAALAVVALAATACQTRTATDEFPLRPIKITVGWSAGGSSDLTTRGLAKEMKDDLGVNINVVNVEGANGGVGGGQVAKEEPNGYSLFGGANVAGVWPVMDEADVGWEDFYALLAGPSPTTIYVKDDSEYETVGDLVAAMKKDPSMRYGTPGPGSNGQIFGELLKDEAGVKAKHVPYTGGSEAGKFLKAGEIDWAAVTQGDLIDMAEAGDMRPLVNLYEEPVEVAGHTVPPITDEYPKLGAYTAVNPWFGIYVSRDTPPAVLQRLSKAVKHATEQKDFKNLYEGDLGGIVDFTTGTDSDKAMARLESGRAWALYELGATKNDPEKVGIPTVEKFFWPPHDRAKKAEPWPKDQ